MQKNVKTKFTLAEIEAKRRSEVKAQALSKARAVKLAKFKAEDDTRFQAVKHQPAKFEQAYFESEYQRQVARAQREAKLGPRPEKYVWVKPTKPADRRACMFCLRTISDKVQETDKESETKVQEKTNYHFHRGCVHARLTEFCDKYMDRSEVFSSDGKFELADQERNGISEHSMKHIIRIQGWHKEVFYYLDPIFQQLFRVFPRFGQLDILMLIENMDALLKKSDDLTLEDRAQVLAYFDAIENKYAKRSSILFEGPIPYECWCKQCFDNGRVNTNQGHRQLKCGHKEYQDKCDCYKKQLIAAGFEPDFMD